MPELKTISIFKKIKIVLLLSLFSSFNLSAQPDRNNTIELKATVTDISSTETQVQICWRNTNPTSIGHAGIRKPQGQQYWSKGFSIAVSDTCFLDTIPTNSVYDYCVLKDTNAYGVSNYGYISVGNKVTAELDRGNVILVFDTTYESIVTYNYEIFKKDLIGDGWQINEFRVDSGTSIATIKAGIVSRYTANPTRIKQVILIGNIKVPYSGDFNSTTLPPPDFHFPDHNGAWPTDAYYGDIQSGSWTDATVNNSTGTRSENHNTVGDGKFDQSILPGLQELSVGRIDMSELPAFSSSEAILMNIYFSKNHAYRHGLFNVVDSAVLDYNLGTAVGAEDFGATQCYRNMAPFYGYGAVNEADYFTTLQASNYKWAFGYGAGNYGSISGVGVTANFASAGRQVRSIFNVFYGSYFTDFDNSNNFLKAAIAPYGSSLISVAGGRPNLFLQSMAMGKSIGYSVQESQNNLDVAFSTQLFTFYGYGTRFVTTSLLGDPTLRLDYVNPVSNITFCRDSIQSDTLRVFWHSPNNETSIDSYYVYRGDQVLDSFAFVGSTADTFYFDTATQKTKVYYYMIRASKLDSNCSGNYFNLSQGVCAFTSYMEKDSFSDTLSLCLGDSIQIGRSINESEEGQNYTYTWSPNSFIVDSSSHRTMAFPVSNTLYILETKDKMGITAYDTFLVEIDTLPSNGITVTNQSVSCGDTVTMISNPAPTSGLFYTWTFNNATPGTTSGATSNGPHTVIFDSSGSQQVNLDITYNFGTCTYQDSIGVIINCTTLPIDLLAFEANKEGDNIRLNWQTASEWNNHFFTILRSLDGVNFEPISKVYSKATGGNSISLLNYNYLDSKVPNNSIIYYKLMQQDYNGAQEQSNIVTVNQDLLQSISPNPFNEFIILNGFGEVKNVELFSINGIMVKSINNPKGSIDTKNLPLGFYLIKIKTVSGVYSEKLIKQ